MLFKWENPASLAGSMERFSNGCEVLHHTPFKHYTCNSRMFVLKTFNQWQIQKGTIVTK